VVNAITSAEKFLNNEYPRSEAKPEITAIPTQIPKTYFLDLWACFIPAELDKPSGIFDKKIATTVIKLTVPP
jgi:hypothetical protein